VVAASASIGHVGEISFIGLLACPGDVTIARTFCEGSPRSKSHRDGRYPRRDFLHRDLMPTVARLWLDGARLPEKSRAIAKSSSFAPCFDLEVPETNFRAQSRPRRNGAQTWSTSRSMRRSEKPSKRRFEDHVSPRSEVAFSRLATVSQ
jgi:hypothetical protein